MIHLSSEHKIVRETLEQAVNSDKFDAVDVRAADFDDVIYYVHTPDLENKQLLNCSVLVPSFESIVKQCGEQYFKDMYGDMFIEAEKGYSATCQVDLSKLSDDSAEKSALVAKLSAMKRDVLGAPLWQSFKALTAGSPLTTTFIIQMREHERMYIVPMADRVVVVWSIYFEEKVDSAIADVFLQETVIARKKAPPTAPQVMFKPDPPLELSNIDVPEAGTCIGFLSLALETRHMAGERMEKSVGLVVNYKAYLLYHIKCQKTEMHSRMRSQTNTWLQVLNRARPETTTKEKRDIKGRVFKRG